MTPKKVKITTENKYSRPFHRQFIPSAQETKRLISLYGKVFESVGPS